jgi:hypothetical protein
MANLMRFSFSPSMALGLLSSGASRDTGRPKAGPDETGITDRTDQGERAMIRQPWYLRQDFWMWMGVIFVPFFWVLPLGRLALARVTVRRNRRF